MKRVFFFFIVGVVVLATVGGQIQAQQTGQQAESQTPAQQAQQVQVQALNNQQLTELLLKAAKKFDETAKTVKEMPDLVDKKIRQKTVELDGPAHKDLKAADKKNAEGIKAAREEVVQLRSELVAVQREMKAWMEKATQANTAAIKEAKGAVEKATSAIAVAGEAKTSANQAVGYATAAQEQSATAVETAGSAKSISAQAIAVAEESKALATEGKEQAASAVENIKDAVIEAETKLSDRIGEMERAMLALSRSKDKYYAEIYSRFNGDVALLRAFGLSKEDIEKGKKEAEK